MKRAGRILCLIALLCLMTPGMASMETKLFDPVAIVAYDRTAMIDWTPSYGLTMPGVLLELTHAEAMLSITAVEKAGTTPEEYLSERLDRAGETLAVSDAQISVWADPFESDGQCLAYSYTYPEGDEIHLSRSWVASREDMLIDLTIDAWGVEAEMFMEAARTAFIEGGFTLMVSDNAIELTAMLSDVIELENGLASIQLTEPDEDIKSTEKFHPLSENAVVLFPNPDDLSLLYPVAPDFASLVDAILTYEESSDSPTVFRTIIDNNQIVYMEYGLMQ